MADSSLRAATKLPDDAAHRAPGRAARRDYLSGTQTCFAVGCPAPGTSSRCLTDPAGMVPGAGPLTHRPRRRDAVVVSEPGDQADQE